jgi:hypothetical protein
LKEELHGDQHKLDHDEDGKITKHDMKKVRKHGPNDDHPLAEDDLNELSPKTLGSYIKKSRNTLNDIETNTVEKDRLAKKYDKLAKDHKIMSSKHTGEMERKAKEYDDAAGKSDRKYFKRDSSIDLATDKLTGQAKVPAKDSDTQHVSAKEFKRMPDGKYKAKNGKGEMRYFEGKGAEAQAKTWARS